MRSDGPEEAGYVEGRNVAIEYRWADQQNDRLPAMAADLVQRHVNVIAASTTPGGARGTGGDHNHSDRLRAGPTRFWLGLVTQPKPAGRQRYGRDQFVCGGCAKAVGIAARASANREKVMALLVNPADRNLAQIQSREVLSAARNRGLRVACTQCEGSEGDFDAVFTDIKRLRVDGLGTAQARDLPSPASNKLAALTVRHAVPAIYSYRVFPAAGGLMSYGTDIFDSYRLAGVYTGRVLKGENPAELPVVQATKFELVINLKAAKALGISVPSARCRRARTR